MILVTTSRIVQALFSLIIVSAIILSTTRGYSAALSNPEEILGEVTPTPNVQNLATQIRQHDKKIFISYSHHDSNQSTVPMVNDFEQFIQSLGIRSYYRDTHMADGDNIGAFMQNAGRSDVVVVFLNDAYLQSIPCMREFFQVWDIENRSISPKAFILLHPEFNDLFGGDASNRYREHWNNEYTREVDRLRSTPAADRERYFEQASFLTKIEQNIGLNYRNGAKAN